MSRWELIKNNPSTYTGEAKTIVGADTIRLQIQHKINLDNAKPIVGADTIRPQIQHKINLDNAKKLRVWSIVKILILVTMPTSKTLGFQSRVFCGEWKP